MKNPEKFSGFLLWHNKVTESPTTSFDCITSLDFHLQNFPKLFTNENGCDIITVL